MGCGEGQVAAQVLELRAQWRAALAPGAGGGVPGPLIPDAADTGDAGIGLTKTAIGVRDAGHRNPADGRAREPGVSSSADLEHLVRREAADRVLLEQQLLLRAVHAITELHGTCQRFPQ